MGSWIRKGRKLVRLLRSAGYRRGVAMGVAAAVEHEGAMRSIAFASALDVGANIGQFSLLLREIQPKALIHAFEPLDGPAATHARLFAHDPGVTLHRCAAGDSPGEVEIHISGRNDSSSLLPITAAQSKFYPGTAEVARQQVAVRRIDDILSVQDLPQPLLVKLDVQGFELAALKGMPNVLAHAQYVFAEISFVEFYEGQVLAPEIIGWLAERGLSLAGIYNLSVSDDGVSLQADALFRRGASPAQ